MPQTNKLVSIIIPVYNAEKYLDSCLRSVTGQTYRHLEIILVDDGAKDGSPALCDAWAKKDSRIRVIHQPNGGVSAARNAGIEAATGEYIQFVDSDDRIHRQMISSLVQEIEQENADIVFFRFQVVEERNGRVIARTPLQDTPLPPRQVFERAEFLHRLVWLYRHVGGMEGCWNRMYRKTLILDNHLRFPVGIQVGEDNRFNIGCYAHCHKTVFLSDIFYDYIRRENETLSTAPNPTLYQNQMEQLDALQAMLTQHITLTDEHKADLAWYRAVYIYNVLLSLLVEPNALPLPERTARLSLLLEKGDLRTYYLAGNPDYAHARRLAPYVQAKDVAGLQREYTAIRVQAEQDKGRPVTFFFVRQLRSYAEKHPDTRAGKLANVLQLNLATVGVKETARRIFAKLLRRQ